MVESNDNKDSNLNSSVKRASKSKKNVKSELLDIDELREIKKWQIWILVNSVKNNLHFLYPLPREAWELDRKLFHKIICGIFVKNIVYKNENETVCICPFVVFQFNSYGEKYFIEWLEKELEVV